MKLGGQHAIHLHDDGGKLCSFLPGDEVPEWARKSITNPLAWEGSEPDEPAVVAAPLVITVGGGAGWSGAEAVSEPDAADGTLPKQTGPDASRVKWAAYAEARGVAVPEDWKRADIIAACEQAGVPVL